MEGEMYAEGGIACKKRRGNSMQQRGVAHRIG